MDDLMKDDSNKAQNEFAKKRELSGYRKRLAETEKKIADSLLKTLLTLSGGSLGLSFAFIKDIVGDDPMKSHTVLVIAWSMLTVSLTSVLLSLYINMIAHRHAIKQVDNNTIYEETPGGIYGKAMPFLNLISISTLIAGVVLLFVFAFKNLGGKP